MVNKFNDGISSKSFNTEVIIGIAGLSISYLDMLWKFEDIRIVQNPEEGFSGVLTNYYHQDQRLVIGDNKLFAEIKNNISHSRINFIYFKEFVREYYKLLTILFIAILALPSSLQILSNQLDEDFMKRIGDDYLEIIVTEKNQCKNPEGTKELQILIDNISDKKGYYKVFIVKKDVINAIALPGGSIVIYSELLDKFQNPDELAFILGHEIGHIKQEHHKYNFIVGSLLSRINHSLAFFLQMKHSRGAEIEADEFGYNLMIRNNIDPKYGIDAFGRLKSEDDLDKNIEKLLSYISTHPATDDRIDIIKEKTSKVHPDKQRNFSPVISNKSWKKITNICDTKH